MLPRGALLLCAALALHAQSSAPDLKFDVASIKPSPPNAVERYLLPLRGGESYRGRSITLKDMIQSAYSVSGDQVLGGPSWINQDRFDIEAKADHVSTSDELRGMLRTLLAERFQLQVRREAKQFSVYLLTVDRGGLKMTPHEARIGGDALIIPSVERPLHIKIKATAATMEYLARSLRPYIDRPVADHTGLTGGYDFSLAFTMEPPESMHEGMLGHDGKPIDFSGPKISDALRQQLGLRLEPGKGPLDVFVIERAEKPDAN
jgi:uncharacterized protein (TIGR03435 family)